MSEKKINLEKIKKEFSKTTNIQEMMDAWQDLGDWVHQVIEIKRNSLKAEDENLKSIQEQITKQ